ncbi:MAG: 4-hydroxybenzoate octaprenyltransferase, partial [Oceanicaulis sp.]
ALAGVKSSARALGSNIRPGVGAFYALTVLCAVLAGVWAGAGLLFAFGVAAFAGHLFWQVQRLDAADGADCLTRFKSNRDAGLLLTLAFVLGQV